MGRLNINTNNVKSAAEDLKKQGVELNNILSNIYEKISNISNDGVWSSDSDRGSASVYIKNCLKDKTSSLELSTSIKKLGDELVDFVNSIEKTSNSSGKIFVDTDKISNSMQPLIKSQKQKIYNTRNIASSFNYPNGEYNWREVVSKIDDCCKKTDSYISWSNDLNKDLINDLNNGRENIKAINVTNVTKNNMIVK